jgi:hypothetical protein
VATLNDPNVQLHVECQLFKVISNVQIRVVDLCVAQVVPLKCKFNHHLYTHYLSGTTPHQNWTRYKKEVYGQCVSELYQMLSTGGGRTLFVWSCHEVTLCSILPFSWKIRPISMLRQPMENRKNAEMSAKLSKWCKRMAAPILCGIALSAGEKQEGMGREGAYRHCITPSDLVPTASES